MIRDRNVLAVAIANNLATAEELELWVRAPEPDPLDGLDTDQLVDYAIAHAASGIWATCPPPNVQLDDGRRVTIPPGYRARRRARRRART